MKVRSPANLLPFPRLVSCYFLPPLVVPASPASIPPIGDSACKFAHASFPSLRSTTPVTRQHLTVQPALKTPYPLLSHPSDPNSQPRMSLHMSKDSQTDHMRVFKALRRSIKGEKDGKPPHVSIAPKSALAIVPPKKVRHHMSIRFCVPVSQKYPLGPLVVYLRRCLRAGH